MPSNYNYGYGPTAKQIREQALPKVICCKTCKKNKPIGQFSEKQIADLKYKLRVYGETTSSAHKQIKCQMCTGVQRTEMLCIICHKHKPLEFFAKTHRRTPDEARCQPCMQDIQNVNPDEQFVPEGEDDDDSNSVISSRTSETNPIRSVWEMTEDDEYATRSDVSESDGGVALGSSASSLASTSRNRSVYSASSSRSTIGASTTSHLKDRSVGELSRQLDGVSLASGSAASQHGGSAASNATKPFDFSTPYDDEEESDSDDDDYYSRSHVGTQIVSGRSTADASHPNKTQAAPGGVKPSAALGTTGVDDDEEEEEDGDDVESVGPWSSVSQLEEPKMTYAAGNARSAVPGDTGSMASGFIPVPSRKPPSASSGVFNANAYKTPRSVAVGSSASSTFSGPGVRFTGYDPTGGAHELHAPRHLSMQTPQPTKPVKSSHERFPRVRPTGQHLTQAVMTKDEGHQLRLEDDSSDDDSDE